MKVAILLDQDLAIPLSAKEHQRFWDIKAELRVPKEIRLHLRGSEESFIVDELANRKFAPRVRVKWGFFPAQWFGLRKFVLHLTDGNAYIEAGLFDNRMGMVLKTQLFAKKFVRFDFWQTFQSNFALFKAGNWAFRLKK